jgi:calcineurin-like phosphoesterase family protein
MPRVFVVADTHFGHENIIEYERRPFRSVEEMDAVLVRFWNQVVGEEDTVWHLGDVAVCGAERTRELVRALRGRKHLVLGNHDLSRTVTFWKKAGFLEVFEGPVELPGVLLSHGPAAEVLAGRINVHGHCHGRGSAGRRAVCVSVELTGYRPVLLGAGAVFVGTREEVWPCAPRLNS